MLRNLVIKAANDKNFRNKMKNTAYTGFKTAQSIKKNGNIMRTLGKKAGKIRRKIKGK